MSETIPKKEDSKVRGIIFMNLFCFLLTVNNCIFKNLAKEGVSNLDFAVFRPLVALFCITLYNWYLGVNPVKALPRKHYVKMVIRSLLGTWGFILWFYIITMMPLTLATVIFQTNPFWMTILAICFLQEKIMIVEIIAMVLSFGGVIMVTLSPDDSSLETKTPLILGVGLCLVMAWTHAVV